MEGIREIIDTIAIDTVEWREATVIYGQSGEDLETQMALSMCFGRIKREPERAREDRKWDSSFRDSRHMGVDRHHPQFRKRAKKIDRRSL